MKHVFCLTLLLLLVSGCSKNEAPPLPEKTSNPPPVVQTSAPTQTPPEPVETEEPVPTSQPDLSKTQEQVEEMVKNVANAAAEYVNTYGSQTQFVSKNGYLAESAGDIYVSPSSMVELTNMNPDYANENVLLLYVIPDDVKEYTDYGDGLTPTVYAAYETEEGFVLAGAADSDGRSGYGIISKDEFEGLMEKYVWNSGDIVRYNSGSDEFNNISKALTDTTGWKELDVRHMVGDGKYISAVVSPKENPLDIREYVLRNNSGTWMTALTDIEKTNLKFTVINKALPDMNLGMVPRYQLVDSLKFVRNDFLAIINAMKKENLVGSNDGEPEFVSGDNEFVYIIFSSGKRFLGNNDEDIMTWVMYPIENYDHAIETMKKFAKFTHPSYFLIRQD